MHSVDSFSDNDYYPLFWDQAEFGIGQKPDKVAHEAVPRSKARSSCTKLCMPRLTLPQIGTAAHTPSQEAFLHKVSQREARSKLAQSWLQRVLPRELFSCCTTLS